MNDEIYSLEHGGEVTYKKIMHLLKTRHPKDWAAQAAILFEVLDETAHEEMVDHYISCDMIYKRWSALLYATLAAIEQQKMYIDRLLVGFHRNEGREALRRALIELRRSQKNPYHRAFDAMEKAGLVERVEVEDGGGDNTA